MKTLKLCVVFWFILSSCAEDRKMSKSGGDANIVVYKDGTKIKDLPASINLKKKLPLETIYFIRGQSRTNKLQFVTHTSPNESQIHEPEDFFIHKDSNISRIISLGKHGFAIIGYIHHPESEGILNSAAAPYAIPIVIISYNGTARFFSQEILGRKDEQILNLRSIEWDTENRLYYSFGRSLHYIDLKGSGVFQAGDTSYDIHNLGITKSKELIVLASKWNESSYTTYYRVKSDFSMEKITSDSSLSRLDDSFFSNSSIKYIKSNNTTPDLFNSLPADNLLSAKIGTYSTRYLNLGTIRFDINNKIFLFNPKQTDTSISFTKHIQDDLAFETGNITKLAYINDKLQLKRHLSIQYNKTQPLYNYVFGKGNGIVNGFIGTYNNSVTNMIDFINTDGTIAKSYNYSGDINFSLNNLYKIGNDYYTYTSSAMKINFDEAKMTYALIEDASKSLLLEKMRVNLAIFDQGKYYFINNQSIFKSNSTNQDVDLIASLELPTGCFSPYRNYIQKSTSGQIFAVYRVQGGSACSLNNHIVVTIFDANNFDQITWEASSKTSIKTDAGQLTISGLEVFTSGNTVIILRSASEKVDLDRFDLVSRTVTSKQLKIEDIQMAGVRVLDIPKNLRFNRAYPYKNDSLLITTVDTNDNPHLYFMGADQQTIQPLSVLNNKDKRNLNLTPLVNKYLIRYYDKSIDKVVFLIANEDGTTVEFSQNPAIEYGQFVEAEK